MVEVRAACSTELRVNLLQEQRVTRDLTACLVDRIQSIEGKTTIDKIMADTMLHQDLNTTIMVHKMAGENSDEFILLTRMTCFAMHKFLVITFLFINSCLHNKPIFG